MALPKVIRRLTPDRLRDDPRLRALAVGAGLIPPRVMHTAAEAELLRRLADGRSCAVEIGVYEGSSAVVLCRSLPAGAELHLVDPYVGDALRPGWRGSEAATRRVVRRALRERRSGPAVSWHVARSEEAIRGFEASIDLLFIDGDHSEAGCRRDFEDWGPRVEPGGVVLFHDARADRDGGWGLPGPTAVVDGLFRGASPIAGWRIAREVDSSVVVERT